MTPDTIIAMTANDTLWFKPGTSWRYDNSGYVVLGMLIEKVTGHPWGTELAERFFKPLGLTSTDELPDDAARSGIVRRATQPVKGGWRTRSTWR